MGGAGTNETDTHQHNFSETPVFAGGGVRAVGTNESNTYRRTEETGCNGIIPRRLVEENWLRVYIVTLRYALKLMTSSKRLTSAPSLAHLQLLTYNFSTIQST